MNTLAQLLSAIRSAGKAFLTGLRKMFGNEGISVPQPNKQLLVDRSVEGAVAMVALAFAFLPGNQNWLIIVANVLFGVANWTRKQEPDAYTRGLLVYPPFRGESS